MRGDVAERLRRGLLGLAAVAAVAAAPADAATLPPNFSEVPVATGLAAPTALALAPGGLIYVAQQGGALRVVENGTLLSAPFVTLTVDSAGERGLIGVTVDPAFADNRYVYVHYTVPGNPAHNRVSRFTADLAGTAAVPGTEVPLVELDSLSSATNHNGGAIHFGPDGKLYIAVGENANAANAQTLANRHGKMLRLNPDGSIPSDNPFLGSTSSANRAIWALGLRNPFTFAFQPGTTLRMFVNDVGQNAWEEINEGSAAANYGWPTCEGPSCSAAPPAGYVPPLFSYAHSPPDQTTGCAIVGAAFYNPAASHFPADYTGDYFFADLCRGWIRRLDLTTPPTAQGFATGVSTPVDLAVADDGRLYYLARGIGTTTGVLYRVSYAAPTALLAGSFAATRVRRGAELRWRANHDARVLGFHVYRGAKRLTRALLPPVHGLPHVFVDRAAPRRGAVYRLEAVLLDGTRSTAATATLRPAR